MSKLNNLTRALGRNKLVFAFVMVLAFSIFATSASALGSSRSYFEVEKPSSTSQCEGGEWVTVREWSWRHGIKRIQKYIPNWDKLGFRSYQQCINYTSTPKPTSKEQCRRQWRQLGFRTYGDCKKYLRLHPGGGYGGTQFNQNNNDDDDNENRNRDEDDD